jgi:hypothetical protein
VSLVRPVDDDRFDRRFEQLHVVHIRARNHDAQRPSRALDDQALLRARLGSIGRIGTSVVSSEAALVHEAVGRLPAPVDGAERLALGQAVDRAVVTELFG